MMHLNDKAYLQLLLAYQKNKQYLCPIYCKHAVLLLGPYHVCLARLCGEVKGGDLILKCQGMFRAGVWIYINIYLYYILYI